MIPGICTIIHNIVLAQEIGYDYIEEAGSKKINFGGSVGIEASTGDFMPDAGRSIKVLKNLKHRIGFDG
ncbi:MAG TPA: hypothetical protein PKX71_05455 [Candidatus Avimonas sp.]|nr:hypothetical protein [Clostridiales bacterium]HOB36873.1 hypothetical protein [Candidatus Avimonas sp.]HQA16386.1 hypothetical protein [Candidatus Avimonas sp.]HQD37937.1 hypothetical protein [Candidatus Avimonas sp.]